MLLTLIDMLANAYQSGNLEHMESLTYTMLKSIPNDSVALQFLGLTLYMKGRTEEAFKVLQRYTHTKTYRRRKQLASSCESTIEACYRAATRPGSGLSGGWRKIAQLFASIGYVRHAASAERAAVLSIDRENDLPETAPKPPAQHLHVAGTGIDSVAMLLKGPALQSSLSQLTLILDRNGYICGYEGNTEALIGYRQEELCQRHVSMLIPKLEHTDLFCDQRLNPRLTYLCHVGASFALRNKSDASSSCSLILTDLGNSGSNFVRLTILLAGHETLH